MQSFINPLAFAIIKKEQVDKLTNQNYKKFALEADVRIHERKMREKISDAKLAKYR